MEFVLQKIVSIESEYVAMFLRIKLKRVIERENKTMKTNFFPFILSLDAIECFDMCVSHV